MDKIGEGHGIEGRFAGLADPYGAESIAEIVILPVPFDLTSTYGKGADKGPEALIEASRNLELYDIPTDSEVYLHGIFTAHPILAMSSEALNQELHRKVIHWLKEEKFVVTIGGEHSVSYATIKAHAEHYGKITVLQFDAHADLQQAYENDPWSHASVMARVKEIPQVENVISVGIRSLSANEKPFVDDANTFYAYQLDTQGKWMEQVLEKLDSPVYITFDLDAFDSSLMPSTGTPEPGGLFWKETLDFLEKVIARFKVIGFDVVELCPKKDLEAADYLAAKLVYRLLSIIFKERKP